MKDRELDIWTVYDHPSDFPTMFVARRFVLDKPTGQIFASKTLEGLRELLAGCGLYRIPRSPEDDPVIVECWL